MSNCKACGHSIVWRKHVTSRQSMPINAAPEPGGNIAVLDGENYTIIPKDEAETRLDLHKSHFGTCLNAQLFRKPKGKT